MLAGFAKLRDDLFVGYAVIEHVVDLLAESKRQAGDFAVAAGFGLAGFESYAEGSGVFILEFWILDFGFWISGIRAPYVGCYGGRKVYRLFTDLTAILMHAIKFFGFD